MKFKNYLHHNWDVWRMVLGAYRSTGDAVFSFSRFFGTEITLFLFHLQWNFNWSCTLSEIFRINFGVYRLRGDNFYSCNCDCWSECNASWCSAWNFEILHLDETYHTLAHTEILCILRNTFICQIVNFGQTYAIYFSRIAGKQKRFLSTK